MLTRLSLASPDARPSEIDDPTAVAHALALAGIAWSRGPIPADPEGAAAAEALAAGWPAWDVVRAGPDHPQAASMRTRFLEEHTHAEDEVRWFLQDGGAFLFVVGDEVWRLACRAGDRVAVPKGVAHGFDPGEPVGFAAIRFLGDAGGWTPRPTGQDRIGRLVARG